MKMVMQWVENVRKHLRQVKTKESIREMDITKAPK